GIREYISEDNPFSLLVEQIISGEKSSMKAKKEWSKQKEFDRQATVSEEFDNLIVIRFYNGLSIGMIARATRFEIDRMLENESYDKDVIKKVRTCRGKCK